MTKNEYNSLPLENRRLFDLVNEYTGGNVSMFANSIGVKQQSVYRVFKIDQRSGKYPSVSSDIKDAIKDKFGIEYSYYVNEDEEEPKLSKSNQSIPFFGESEIVTAGILSGFGNALMAQDITKVITMPMLDKKDGDFALQVRGRSMIDTVHPDQNINDGAIVVLRPWRESFIEWGEIYCIATRNGFVVKRLMPSDSDEKIVCVPSNDAEYKPFDVYKSDITDIAKVKAIINLQIL